MPDTTLPGTQKGEPSKLDELLKQLDEPSEQPWTQEKAIEFCRKLEEWAPKFGMHVALTGGCLYKDGPRKDCDVIVYRHRQADVMRIDDFFIVIGAVMDVVMTHDYGFCKKATWGRRDIDFLFPELEDSLEYEAMRHSQNA